MKYNFDKIVNRRDTNSIKWNVGGNELPMWVADMDFETAPEIKESIMERAAHGVYGYAATPDDWYQSYIDWWGNRHGLTIQKEEMMFCTGVISAISSIVRKLTTPADKILIQTPVYNHFFSSILNNGRQIIESPLEYIDGDYRIDFEDLEQKLSDPLTTMMIICNPHNPIGKIWDKETLKRIGELCKEYHVIVITDEIHCDITAPGYDYVPFASVSDLCRDNCIMCVAPTKTFNLAGLQTSAVIVPNESLRNKVCRGLEVDEVSYPNVFAIDATIAAFTKGENWLKELRIYIQKNKDTAEDYIEEQIPQIKVISSKATYLIWLDCTEITESAIELVDFVRKQTGLCLQSGNIYGKQGKGFIRMNLACPQSVMMDGLERLRDGILAYLNTDYL